jgi:F420-dependent oxidoreductase-like protein
MKLGLFAGYWGLGITGSEQLEMAQEADRLGYDSIWAAEAYGNDAATVLAWLASNTERARIASGIFQMPARTPAMTAMTAATLDNISGGRFTLGLGISGPQVVEGWHGQPWGKPLGKTREYVSIVRAALRREQLEHHGEHYDIPWQNGTGLGKPLKLMARPLRAEIPIYIAAMAPKAVLQACEIADGWLPIFWSPERARDVFGDALAQTGPEFDVAPSVPTILIDDAEAGREFLKPYYALYVGGMGARGKNFYNDLMRRFGYEAEAAAIQDAYLDGRKRDAAELVPDAFVDEVALVGPKERIAERLDAWRESGATTMLVSTQQPEALRALAAPAL